MLQIEGGVIMEQGIGYYFKLISDKIKINADADLKRQGLTLSQSRVLAFLHEKGGQATQKEIEDRLQVSHPTVVGVVSRMEQNGFLVTWFDSEDRRNKIVQLTDKAAAVGQDIDNTVSKQDEIMLRSLTPEQISELRDMLVTIYGNLDNS